MFSSIPRRGQRKPTAMSLENYAPLLCAGLAGGAAALALSALLRSPVPCAITTKQACPAGGHYQQAIASNGQLFVSGLLPITSQGVKLAESSFADQVQAVLANLDAILEAAGTNRDRLISCRVYIDDLGAWGEFNKLYAAWLGKHKPARCVVPVPHLHYGLKLELEAVAAL